MMINNNAVKLLLASLALSAAPVFGEDGLILATDQTSGYGQVQTFSLPAYDGTATKDDYYVLELPKVTAGTTVLCAMTCNQDSYGGTSPNEDDAETFTMGGIFSDSVNPIEDAVFNRGFIRATVYNACEAGIAVVTNMDSDHFFLVIEKPTLGFTDAKVVCKKEGGSCFGSTAEAARNYFRTWWGA